MIFIRTRRLLIKTRIRRKKAKGRFLKWKEILHKFAHPMSSKQVTGGENYRVSQKKSPLKLIYNWTKIRTDWNRLREKYKQNMTPFPHLKQKNQEAGGTPGVKKIQRKLQMNFKEDFFLGHPVQKTKWKCSSQNDCQNDSEWLRKYTSQNDTLASVEALWLDNEEREGKSDGRLQSGDRGKFVWSNHNDKCCCCCFYFLAACPCICIL